MTSVVLWLHPHSHTNNTCISECETSEAFQTILGHVTTACPTGNPIDPSYVMRDDCAALGAACAKALPNTVQLLCTFHVLQAQWRAICEKIDVVCH